MLQPGLCLRSRWTDALAVVTAVRGEVVEYNEFYPDGCGCPPRITSRIGMELAVESGEWTVVDREAVRLPVWAARGAALCANCGAPSRLCVCGAYRPLGGAA